MSAAAIDAAIGRYVFHPPVILLCWLTRSSQHFIARATGFIAACFFMHQLHVKGEPLWLQAVYFAILIVAMLAAGLLPDDKPEHSWRWMRLTLVVAVTIRTVLGIEWLDFVTGLLFTLSAYASTIDTLPPRPKLRRGRRRTAAA